MATLGLSTSNRQQKISEYAIRATESGHTSIQRPFCIAVARAGLASLSFPYRHAGIASSELGTDELVIESEKDETQSEEARVHRPEIVSINHSGGNTRWYATATLPGTRR
ncbi:hypothetical protein E4U21_002538 [Claviceps maximensis]|nr:hypothetical protein E4U21_002538 [Claviceps maximensis]